ncbi:uncharacterized protein LOC134459988 isoform X1 [Engraulis encrasicolus]|uniref:uncharacterized protein LOC134459988 isoform X1 n=1 Tax=Engraulis encrasicolus TaxID=184585 RepID=UPI002FD3BB84
MAGLNRNLRAAFITVNVLLIIVFVMLVTSVHVLTNREDVRIDGEKYDIHKTLWGVVGGILMVSLLGLLGVLKEKRWALILYIIVSVIGVLIFLFFGVPAALNAVDASKIVSLIHVLGMPTPGVVRLMNVLVATYLVPAVFGFIEVVLASVLSCQLRKLQATRQQGQELRSIDQTNAHHPSASPQYYPVSQTNSTSPSIYPQLNPSSQDMTAPVYYPPSQAVPS